MRLSVISISLAALIFVIWPVSALAQGVPINMGVADPFAVLAGTDVTNLAGNTVITGPTPSTTTTAEVGVSPGAAIVGFPPATSGARHAADVLAGQAQGASTAAYLVAAGETPHIPTLPALGGRNLGPGFYQFGSTADLTGILTLTGTNNPNDLWVFQIGSSLSTATGAPGAPGATVSLVNVLPCQVFWQVTSSATIGTYANFVGTILALTSITMNTGAMLTGRALAQNGFVHLDTNIINNPGACAGTGGAVLPGNNGVPPDLRGEFPWLLLIGVGAGLAVTAMGVTSRRRRRRSD
jgi:Ice-binding-like